MESIYQVRELTGGMYFGQPENTEILEDANCAWWTMVYSTSEIERIVHVGFKSAQLRRKHLMSIDERSENGVLWRDEYAGGRRASGRHPRAHVRGHAAMQFRLQPTQFDVVLCENLFGDILGDEAALADRWHAAQRLGATSGERMFGFYEPLRTADIAGKDLANPIAQIRSAGRCCAIAVRERRGGSHRRSRRHRDCQWPAHRRYLRC